MPGCLHFTGQTVVNKFKYKIIEIIMLNSIFKPVPKLEDFKISFKLEEASLSIWLASLANYDAKQACLAILQLLQTLNKTPLKSKQRVLLLNTIREYLLQNIRKLQHSCLEASFPFSREEKGYAQIVVWNYLTLAEGFFLSTENYGFKKSDLAYSIAMTLDSIKQAQLHIAAVYCVPSEGFWQLAYHCFALAEKKKILQTEIKYLDNTSVTINSLFTQILIFQMCDTSQYSPKDMRIIFNFLQEFCHDLEVEKSLEKDEKIFMFDLDSDNAPFNIKALQELVTDSVRYFSPILAAENLEHIIAEGKSWTGALKSINETLFTRVVKTLGLSQKRQYERIREDYAQMGAVGFDSIISFLYKITKDIDIYPKRLMRPKQTSHKEKRLSLFQDSKLTLGQIGLSQEVDDISLQRDLSKNNEQPWTQKRESFTEPPTDVALTKINVFDKSTNGYSVFWQENATKVKIGDIFGIISKDKKRLEIAIIRRIVMARENCFRFGAELLGLKCEIAYIHHSNLKNNPLCMWVIFLQGKDEKTDSIIYKSGSFNIGDYVYLYRNKKPERLVILKKELHSTVSTIHIEIDYRSEELG